MIYCLGIGLSCMESRLLDPSVKVSCGSGMDTCVEALGLGPFGDTTFQGCASTGSGFKPPESIAQGFSLTFNDVKKNGCMSREEIQKKKEKFSRMFGGDIDGIKICFCDCGDCCNQGIKSEGSCSTCPKDVKTEKSNAEKIAGAVNGAIGAGVDKVTGGVSSYVVAKYDTFFPSKIVFIAFSLATLFG